MSNLLMTDRSAFIQRKTKETDISVELNLEGTGQGSFDTTMPFFDHMLDQIARHGLLDLKVICRGDNHIDDHHSVEDIGICFGQALAQALGQKHGISRYGHAYVPLDESLSRVVVDLSGRPGLFMQADFTRASVGGFDVDLFQEFFQALVNHANLSLHLDILRGSNTHHQIESLFKAFARALRMAVSYDSGTNAIPSTKGCL